MARQQEKGLRYFPFDVDFFKDRKIRRLRKHYGSDGIVIYLYILCSAYGEDGFYLKASDNFLCEDIADDLNMSEEKIGQVINFLCQRSLLDSTLWASDKVLTSHGIQARFQEAIRNKAQKTPRNVNPKYWLLDEEETESYIKVSQISDNSEKNNNNSEKNNNNSEKKDTKESKVNKNKTNKIKGNKDLSNTSTQPTQSADDLNMCLRAYEKYIGLVTPSVVEGLEFYLLQGMEKDLIIRVIEYVAEQSGTKRSWQYLRAALLGNLDTGVKTLDDYNRTKKAYVESSKKTEKRSRNRFNNYEDSNIGDYAEVEKEILNRMLSDEY